MPARPRTPAVARPTPRVGPAQPKSPVVFLWREFEKAPEQQREVYGKRVAQAVAELKAELAEHEADAARSAELDRILSHLQMKFDTVYERFTIEKALAESADEIEELFGVDISARMRDIADVCLPDNAEAHLAAALREWHAKVDETPWSQQVSSAMAEERELLARRDALRAAVEERKKQLEVVERMKSENRLGGCANLAEAETMLAYEMRKVTVKDEVKMEDDLTSEISTPPGSPATSIKQESSEDTSEEEEEDDDFIDSI